MFNKTTHELEEMLGSTHPYDIADYVQENGDDMMDGDRDFTRYMRERLKEKGLRKQDVLLRADIAQGYGYKLLTEEKVTRQRDVILRICYAGEFTLAETQQALRIYHMDTLYARDRRDALIMACFNHRPGTILDLNDLLLKNRLQPLRSSGVQE